MLVLARQHNEAIIIGSGANRVRVLVVDLRKDKVRLGIECPKTTPVHREEVHDAIVRQGGDLLQRPSTIEDVIGAFVAFRDLVSLLPPSGDCKSSVGTLSPDVIKLGEKLANYVRPMTQLAPPLAEKDA